MEVVVEIGIRKRNVESGVQGIGAGGRVVQLWAVEAPVWMGKKRI